MIGVFWWVIIAGIYLGSLASGDTRLFIFAMILTLATLASAIWSKYSLNELYYHRKLTRSHIFLGEETEINLELYNAKPLPLPWVLVRDQYPDGLSLLTGQISYDESLGFRRGLINFLALRWYERVRRTYRLRGDKRGAYNFGPAEIHAGDVFGFRRRQVQIPQVDTLIVYPKIVPVEALGLPAGRPMGEKPMKRRLVEDPLRYVGVREYRPGDSIRHVHWKATARTSVLQTRTFDPSASHSLMLLLDVQTSNRPYSMVSDYLELLISAAASVAVEALNSGYAVGLLANATATGSDGNSYTYVPLGNTPQHAAAILEALACLDGFRLQPFPKFLSAAMADLPIGATVMAFSNLAEDDILETLLRLQDSGHPTVLLTAGEQAAQVPPEIDSHYLGGVDAWRKLASLELA